MRKPGMMPVAASSLAMCLVPTSQNTEGAEFNPGALVSFARRFRPRDVSGCDAHNNSASLT